MLRIDADLIANAKLKCEILAVTKPCFAEPVQQEYTNRLAVHQTVYSHRSAQAKNWKYTTLTNAEAAMSDTQNYTDGGLLLHVFTDGSFDPKSKAGGWGFAVFRGSAQAFAAFGGEARTANNAMELLAILKACEWLADNSAGEEAVIHTDSAYAVNGCTRWRHIWRSNKWRKRTLNGQGRSRSVPDVAYWQAIDMLLNQNPTIKVEWCKGHVGVEGNEVADILAERGRMIGGG